jgi:hypothetical protein
MYPMQTKNPATGIELRTFVEQGTYLNQTKNPASGASPQKLML